MKIFILSADFSPDSPVWINIFWPHFNAISQSVETVFLSSPEELIGKGRIPRLDRRLQRNAHAKRLIKEVEAQLDPDGPNVLLVWALVRHDIERAEMLAPIWDRFSHHVFAALDNLKTVYVKAHMKGNYDRITSFCGDQAEELERATGIKSLFMPPHTDTLTFHNTSSYRPVDLFLVGRRDPDVYNPIHHHFNQNGKNRYSLDFVSRNRNTRYSSEEEFRLLATNYARSKTAFCFEPSKLDRFQSRSPMTERWVHAWTSGCTVIGRAPTGKGVADVTNWHESMLDLPEDPQDAIEATEAILTDEAGLAERRIRNVAEALRRHDTRHRLHQLLVDLGLPVPEALTTGLEKLRETAKAVEDAG